MTIRGKEETSECVGHTNTRPFCVLTESVGVRSPGSVAMLDFDLRLTVSTPALGWGTHPSNTEAACHT